MTAPGILSVTSGHSVDSKIFNRQSLPADASDSQHAGSPRLHYTADFMKSLHPCNNDSGMSVSRKLRKKLFNHFLWKPRNNTSPNDSAATLDSHAYTTAILAVGTCISAVKKQ